MPECLALATQHRHTVAVEVTVGCPYFSQKEKTVHTARIRAKVSSENKRCLLLICGFTTS